MSSKEEKVLDYMVICIHEFAKQKNITRREAYNYLKEFKGLAFLEECYEAEHTLSLNDAVEDITDICIRNGGKIK